MDKPLTLLALPEQGGLTVLTPFTRAWPAYDRDAAAAAELTQRLADLTSLPAWFAAVRGHVGDNAFLASRDTDEQRRQLRYLDDLEVVYAEPDPQVRHVTLEMAFTNPVAEVTDLLAAARTATETP